MNWPVEGPWVLMNLDRWQGHEEVTLARPSVLLRNAILGVAVVKAPQVQCVRIVYYPTSWVGRLRFWLAGIR